ncbi:MAG: alpha/beta hydrolase [Pseudomonadota bacterium]|jgi:lipase|uniref:Acyl-CoA esterase n=1 Tax=anaerobic digester metagenome TaxID=1263854 RepID=A0A485M0T7_9ZZZZ|nr:alpha/beta hydrolase [Pseudomonadota bacterium]HON37321.1 alpha/beta hydrolase [Deltaproteobacteria bacterium]HPD21412.1 alpha/beta hydrolase [Deltaproteobacteria bacterium]HRS56198.1 alpha/beta hydrolase [Desulfomonilia bacterium]HRV35989.1 alpha/beta hydrolase [Desulfomonilia bacterium]
MPEPEHNQPRTLSQDIGDAEISYLLYEGRGPTLILMHATGFQPWLWHPIARALAPTYRVIAPYFCDHRSAEPEDGGLSWMRLAEDIAVFCSRLGIENPGLVGHSMGATVLTLAHAELDLGARGLILIEPIFLPQDVYRIRLKVDDHPLASRSIRRKSRWNSREEAYAYLKSKTLFHGWDREMLDLYIEHGIKEHHTGGLALACSPRHEASLFMGGLHYDPWPLLPKVSCPALVLEGELSENRAFIDLKKATSSMKHAEYRLIEGAGHLIPMEKPGEIAGIIRGFFEDT